ncbi:hypothetical protein [Sphingomonas dokdonensis]|uniref:Uncharacterized protein n=1 Tax=Sphingomonas dokdonensis TaxID=344880 RepID=A0A245ZCY3_9SPHN|nr:hypothetical protein [Sphingomonas dokdonensis]OWK27549.1 hypothetical protein SPDO_32320 [Sphingomonas dokdonensis]
MMGAAPRTGKAVQAPTIVSVIRMTGLATAAEMLGQEQLAEGLGIKDRSLRTKLTATRGVSDQDLIAAALALEATAARMLEHAGKLRTEAGL